ncbi:GNAT family N-acetyltransferase [Lysinibacillus sp. SGAir0095]|uniref:GNAT family N-acetyltransferase n=1 Tax=Lysinibacillus sp. SGAir0095 TaxID=2070463 RepID=UPI00197C59C6|nr:N-acetyltransferase [Lysinibacillus sp. SGAir0095]
MKIRAARLEDAKAIAKVQVDTWRTTYKNIVPEDYLRNMSYEHQESIWKQIIPQCYVYIAETRSGEIIGFASGGRAVNGEYDDYPGELTAIYILEEYQSQGIGRLLFEAIVRGVHALGFRSMILFVLEDNPAKDFYRAIGGQLLDRVEIEIGGKILYELVYAWDDISEVLNNAN